MAAEISDDARAAMRAARAAIETAIARASVPPRITWVNDGAAHVTLRFIGEVPEDVAERAASALAAPLPMAPFEVEWTEIGLFPPGRSGLRSPRAVWLGASRGGDALIALAAAVDGRLAPVVGAGDDRAHTPHVTLGRVKRPGKGVPWADVLTAARPKPVASRVDHVTLFHSQLSSRGPTYTAVVRSMLDRIAPRHL